MKLLGTNFLISDTYNFNVYHSFIGFKLLTSDDDEFWNKLDNEMNNSVNEMFSNKKLYNKLVFLTTTTTNDSNNNCKTNYIDFLTKIIENFVKYGINKNKDKIRNICNIIKNNESQIAKKLYTFNKININKSVFDNNKNNKRNKVQIKLDRNNYFY